MSGAKFTDEFKRDAVAQVEDRGYPVREVAERLGVSVKASQRQRVSTSAGSLVFAT
jgi:transposase-like protein